MWNVETVKEYVGTNPFKVVFTKTDGTERVMNATLNSETAKTEGWEPTGVVGRKTLYNLKVFDLDKKAWRSLNTKTIKTLETKYGLIGVL